VTRWWIAVLLAGVAVAGCTTLPAPRASPYHSSDADLSVTRILHGSVILEMHGTRVLVDPWFNSGYMVRQTEPLGLVPDGLPPLAAVLLTHGHPDHFDADALAKLSATVPNAVAPAALHDRLVKLGFRNVTSLGWWEHVQIDGIDVVAVPARPNMQENGYVLSAAGTTAYVAGDTQPPPELVDIATRFPDIDAALLPIGGLRVLGFRREMNAEEAAETAARLHPRRVIPIGYGAGGGFPVHAYASDPVAAFVAACKRQGIEDSRVVVLQPGESWHYYR